MGNVYALHLLRDLIVETNDVKKTVMAQDYVLIHNVSVVLVILEKHVKLKYVRKIALEKGNVLKDIVGVIKDIVEYYVRNFNVNRTVVIEEHVIMNKGNVYVIKDIEENIVN